MAENGHGPDFIEAISRGLDVLRSFSPARPRMSLSEVAQAAELARPTARRILLTLEELGYVRISNGSHALTPRVLELGMAYVGSLGLWDMARPHLEELARRTNEPVSMAQLDGSDIVYVAQVVVPKLIALRVDIGTRFPALLTSQGMVLLAALDPEEALNTLTEPSRSGLPTPRESREEILAATGKVRDQGWAVADQVLAPGVRSVSVPVADGSGKVQASINVTVNAAEIGIETLVGVYLPLLQEAAEKTHQDWARWQSRPSSSRTAPGGAVGS
ncbi:IclR family transcriptional regulator domain-containing protein [Arthrobacter sp. B2a2-09]|uniref:IclR family transcriptional regulator domain-containing protein n=1 Tax=Arthrobacter sp. B2a2-09 TaxID=2952822 RepID=UPI0022CD2EA1|nr:helix-turn-helix domain-containing protein [Arthrobacter sp. B2a2-09]MCZ9880234.1 helix-turn-helix domain-containing protein [Arthrobacter sp. B2a2-09]